MAILATHKTLPDTATQGHPATVISVTPVGSIESTNVQLAIQELDSEKADVSHTHDQLQTRINLLLVGV